jgi:hypothetical protein
MRGLANGSMREAADIYRNEGYGWMLVGQTKCTIHHRITPPVPGDPADANAANAEYVEIHLPVRIPVRIGDRVHARGKRWTVGGGDMDESYGTFNRAVAARPVAATPRIWITLRRMNYGTGMDEIIPPQLVQVAWAKTQPDRIGGEALRQYGWIFAPEELGDLNIRQGDTFFYAGTTATVQWVPPDPTERREATFWMNVGEGT